MNKKKILWISLAALDVGVTTFLFVIHILMLVNIVGKTSGEVQHLAQQQGLIPFLINHLTLYLCLFVIPLFLILAGNIVFLVFYVRKQSKPEKVTVNDLSDEEKEKLKQELLKDLDK